jgi:hypothetical protein
LVRKAEVVVSVTKECVLNKLNDEKKKEEEEEEEEVDNGKSSCTSLIHSSMFTDHE